MFACFCGFGLGHKSTHYVTNIFRDEIKEAFGTLAHDRNDMGEIFKATQPRDGDLDDSEHGDEKGFEDESDGESESDKNSEGSEADLWDHGEDLDYLAFEEELGYAPL